MPKIYSFFFLLMSLGAQPLSAQEIRPRARFSADSVYLGQPVDFSLSVRYPQSLNLLMPDSAFNFAPFELLSYTYFPTKTKDGISHDSVVYTLAAYRLGSPQRLRLPVYIVQGKDSTAIFSPPDSLHLLEVINTTTVDSLQFESDVQLLPVARRTNYPLIGLILLAVLMVAGLSLALFGKNLQRRWQLYRLRKRHKRYRLAFEQALAQYKAGESPEPLLYRWKQYMEQLENRPYTKLSTREIAALKQENERLLPALRRIEGALYGYSREDGLQESLQTLLQEAEEHYQTLRKEILHAE